HKVFAERPIGTRPACGVEGVKIIGPLVDELAVFVAVIANPVHVLVLRQGAGVEWSDPALDVGGPEVEAQTLWTGEITDLATGSAVHLDSVELPGDIVRRPLERVRVVIICQ